jgi:FkbM family methyltransferase
MDLANLKWPIKRLFALMGFQVAWTANAQTLDIHLLHLFTSLSINCVIDVGAYEGTYGRELRHMGYKGHIVSFEPVPENFAVLARVSSGDDRWRVFPYALGERSGQADMNVFSGGTFHSLLTPSEYGLSAFEEKLRLVRIERVKIRRLDDVLDECLAGIPAPRLFLKMDTQGYDLAVLEGAEIMLSRVVALQTEVALHPIYQDMRSTLTNTVPELQRRGFGVTGLFPVTRDQRDGLQIIELDCVMVRSNAVNVHNIET